MNRGDFGVRMRVNCPAGVRWWLGVVLGVAWLLGGAPRAHAQDRGAPTAHLLIVTGAPGEPRFAESFAAAARTLRDAARAEAQAGANVRLLAGSSALGDADGRASRETLTAELRRLTTTTRPGDAVAIVLIGHGSAGDEPRFNLPGPDVSAAEFARWLEPLGDRRLTIVVAASASGDWIPALSAPGRVVVTATRTGFERNESLFHMHFAAAFANGTADADKDGRVSVLEAFRHATREVERAYASSGRLRTEHALLDDDGDGQGSLMPGTDGGDGRLAARTFLTGDATVARLAGAPGADSLLRERAQVEQAIEALRARKDRMDAEAYERELERLVTRLAEIRRRLEPPEEGP